MQYWITIILIPVILIYLWQVLLLRGSFREKLIFFLLRLVTAAVLLTLAMAPRFEMIRKYWKRPYFKLLMDDSPSMAQAGFNPAAFLSELKQQAGVAEVKFSESKIPWNFSIGEQLRDLKRYESIPSGVILYSDGIEAYREEQCPSVPVYLLPTETAPLKTRVRVKELPLKYFKDDTVNLEMELLSRESGTLGNLVVMLNGAELFKKRITASSDINTVEPLRFPAGTPGWHEVEIHWEESGNDQQKQERKIRYFVQNEKMHVAIVASSPSTELMFLLRALKEVPGIDFEVLYTSIKRTKQQEQIKPSLFLYFNIEKQQADLYKADGVPAILVSGKNLEKAESWLEWLPGYSVSEQILSAASFRGYAFESKDFSTLDFYSHEGRKNAVFAGMPPLESLLHWEAPGYAKVPLKLKSNEDWPVLIVNPAGGRISAVLSATDLYRMRFFAGANSERTLFFKRFFGSIVRWAADGSVMPGVEYFVGSSWLKAGEPLSLSAKGGKGMSLAIKNANGAVLFSQVFPVKAEPVLPVGNYELQLLSDGKPVRVLPLHVFHPVEEFFGTGESGLSRSVKCSGGKVLDPEKGLISQVPDHLLQSKLEMVHEKVDLQKNPLVLLVLLLLISIEWIIRYQRKLV
jgi:hypothetical protein